MVLYPASLAPDSEEKREGRGRGSQWTDRILKLRYYSTPTKRLSTVRMRDETGLISDSTILDTHRVH